MSVLDIDLGNSRTKYRFGGRKLLRPAAAALPALPGVTRVRVSSVRGAVRDARLAREVRRRYACEAEFARSVEQAAGVRNGYRQPDALGVDRWLAVLAAHQQFGAALVADLGTAATFDVVTAHGEHLGGFIVPGLRLMRRSLHRDTAAVRVPEPPELNELAPGRSTAEAVTRGLALSLVNMLEAELERAQRLCEHSARLVLCGGDAQTIAAHLSVPAVVQPDLVLDGLALALP